MRTIKRGYAIINGRRVPFDAEYNDEGEFTTDNTDPDDIEKLKEIVNMLRTPRTLP